ncbi:unnamed protein product [Leptosia nina]|uniref:Uncharacterized protein n=1 Tax=Leptosia nina TaxID=320188 RepID=A0AAV1JR78_9NEOP
MTLITDCSYHRTFRIETKVTLEEEGLRKVEADIAQQLLLKTCPKKVHGRALTPPPAVPRPPARAFRPSVPRRRFRARHLPRSLFAPTLESSTCVTQLLLPISI